MKFWVQTQLAIEQDLMCIFFFFMERWDSFKTKTCFQGCKEEIQCFDTKVLHLKSTYWLVVLRIPAMPTLQILLGAVDLILWLIIIHQQTNYNLDRESCELLSPTTRV